MLLIKFRNHVFRSLLSNYFILQLLSDRIDPWIKDLMRHASTWICSSILLRKPLSTLLRAQESTSSILGVSFLTDNLLRINSISIKSLRVLSWLLLILNNTSLTRYQNSCPSNRFLIWPYILEFPVYKHVVFS